MKKFKDSVKFSFTPDFQLEILRFILRDKEGGLVLRRVKSSYLVHRTCSYIRGHIKVF
jgi:hypothetical protein